MPTQSTITEALAELKVIAKRIESKRQFVAQYGVRPEQLKDPLEKDGGSVTAIQRELQAIKDLQTTTVAIRRAIQDANVANNITVNGSTRSIADWLIWRRDVAPSEQNFLTGIRSSIENARRQVVQKGGAVAAAGTEKPGDLVVNVNEQDLINQAEQMEATLGTLDGQFSLKNATITITY